eukprot:2943678-Pleurochrysis_carterae.AAC.1
MRSLELTGTDSNAREVALRYMWQRDYTQMCTARGRGRGEAEEATQFFGGLLARNRNQHFLQKQQLLLTVQARHKQLNITLWAQLCAMRILPSYSWAMDFIADALALESDYVPRYD